MPIRVERATDLTSYVKAPSGRYYAGDCFLHFFTDPTFCGTVFWERPGEQAIRVFTRAVEAELPQNSPKHAALVDARRLTGVDPGAFQVLVEYFGPRAETFGVNVSRQAMLRPDGVLGAIVAGFYDITPNTGPENRRITLDPAEAFGWLGRPVELLAEIDQAVLEATGANPALQALRDHLAQHLTGASLANVARALGVSGRTLQQQLQEAGTTFRQELGAARIRVAKRMLAAGDTKLASIAAEVGCASLQHFSTLFRKQTGDTPSEWRERNRLR
jgi:AraC-like DNA-binding protein